MVTEQVRGDPRCDSGVHALLFHNRFGGRVALVCCRVFFPPPGSTLAFGVALSQSVGTPEAT